MAFQVPAEFEREIDAIIARYPVKRSASLMLLHAVQERFGWISPDSVQWIAGKLGLQPINVFELVTFYPMFRQAPAGKFQFKVCRTLSCALGGSHAVHEHLCRKFGLDPHKHGIQTTPDGRFSVEFVECLAGCGMAPVVMVNDAFHEGVSPERADALVSGCR